MKRFFLLFAAALALAAHAQVSTDPARTGIPSSGTGTVSSVAATGTNGIGVSGSPVTTSGTFALSLGNITPTSVTTGTVTASAINGSAWVAH